MASKLNFIGNAEVMTPLMQYSSKLSRASNGSQSIALPLRATLKENTDDQSGPRRLALKAVSSKAPPTSINLEDDSIKLLSVNGKPKLLSFAVSDVATNDLCDANRPMLETGELRVLPPIFHIYGKHHKFAGPICTLKVDDDNTSVWELVHLPGNGRILLIDAGGQKRCALIGGILIEAAQYMGWAGVVVNGCVRDVDDINGVDIGVRALASHPVKPKKMAPGEKHVPVKIGGALIEDGEWLYADNDGILISPNELNLHAAYEYKVDFEALHSIKNKVKLGIH